MLAMSMASPVFAAVTASSASTGTPDPAGTVSVPVNRDAMFSRSGPESSVSSLNHGIARTLRELMVKFASHTGPDIQSVRGGVTQVSPGSGTVDPATVSRMVRERSGKVVIGKSVESASEKEDAQSGQGLSNPLAEGTRTRALAFKAEEAPENPAYAAWSSLRKPETIGPGNRISAPDTPLGHVPEPVLFTRPESRKQEEKKVTEAVYPARYDLRTLNKVTPVKNQNPCGSCWAHSALASIESFLLPGESWDLSENNMKNTHGFNWLSCEGGNRVMATAYLIRWAGPVAEADDPYNGDPVRGATSPQNVPPQKHIQEVLYIPDKTGPLSAEETKKALMEYGAVHSCMYYDATFFNKVTGGYYYPGNNYANHDITIIGWDNRFSRDNFFPSAPGDGAWIIKNSWGKEWGLDGYFYVSYYDTRIDLENALYIPEPVTNYDTIYQYDPLGLTDMIGFKSPTGMMTNVFHARGNQEISALGFYTTGPDTKYELAVFKGSDPAPSASRKGTIELPGFHTIRLEKPVTVTSGETFTATVKLTTPGVVYPLAVEKPLQSAKQATASEGESYMSADGSSWVDITSQFPNTNACLKAYGKTVQVAGSAPDLTVSSIQVPDSSNPGGTIHIEATVKNLGPGDAPETTVRFSLAPMGAQALGNEVPLGSAGVRALTKGSTEQVSVSFKVPDSAGTQNYYVVATVDPDGLTEESNEQNNQISSESYVRFGGSTADLSMRSLKGPASMASGGVAELTFTVANLGTVTSRVTDMTFFLSKINPQSPDDITILGSAEVPSLGQNGAFSGLYKVNLPENLAEGPYYLGGFIDLSERVSETDDSNNIGMYPVKIRVYNEQNLPDIAAVEVRAPSEARAGGTIAINDTVQNVGFAPSGTFYVGFGLLPDSSDELTFLGMREVSSIDPGTSSVGLTTLTVPSDTKPGVYTLMMVVYTPDGSDPNEDNDYMVAENTISVKEKGKGGKTDLVITTVSGPASAPPGGTVALTATVRNQGSGTSQGFVVGYYLSNNTTVSQKDTLIGSFYVPALAPGISTSGSGPVTLPTSLTPGDYTLGAIADPENEIYESREDNNYLTSGKKVSITSAGTPTTPVVTVTTRKTTKPATTVKAVVTIGTVKPRTTLPALKTSIKNRSV